MPFPQWLVSGVPGLWRIRHLSSSLNKILHRATANAEDKKLWHSVPQNSLHLHLLPTQAIGVQAVANSPWVASYTQFLWLTLLMSPEKQFFCRLQKSSFVNNHKQRGLPNKHSQSVIFFKYFLSSSNERENLPLNKVLCISCNSLDYQHVPVGLSLILLFTAPKIVGFPVGPCQTETFGF